MSTSYGRGGWSIWSDSRPPPAHVDPGSTAIESPVLGVVVGKLATGVKPGGNARMANAVRIASRRYGRRT